MGGAARSVCSEGKVSVLFLQQKLRKHISCQRIDALLKLLSLRGDGGEESGLVQLLGSGRLLQASCRFPETGGVAQLAKVRGPLCNLCQVKDYQIKGCFCRMHRKHCWVTCCSSDFPAFCQPVFRGLLSTVASQKDGAMRRAERGELTLSQVGVRSSAVDFVKTFAADGD